MNLSSTKKPKICFVTSFFYPTLGGVETHIQNTAKELIKLGYDCEAYVSDMDRDTRIPKKRATIDGIKIKRFTKCLDCGYQSMTHGSLKCSKCDGKLEIIASTNKEELVK